MTKPKQYEAGDQVRIAGWPKRTYVTLNQRIETPSGEKGWRGMHSDGYWTHLRDGSFTPRRGKAQREESTNG